MRLGNVLIIGDSYSTFDGHIPEGYVFWYSADDRGRTDVVRAEDTWWHILTGSVDCTLVHNESYSGTTVSNTERPTMPGTSFVYRTERLIEGGFFRDNKIDTVFLFGGTNDSWIDSPVGEPRYEGRLRAHLDAVLPAFCHIVESLREAAPEARLIAIANCDIKDEIREGYLEAAKHYGIELVTLEGISKQNGHPDMKGMRQIAEQVLAAL